MATALVLSPVSFSQESAPSASYEDADDSGVEHAVCEEAAEIAPQTMEIVEANTDDPASDNTNESLQADDTMDSSEDEMLAQAIEASIPIRDGYAGIENLGNTCYASASLQMLASLPSFVESVREFHDSQQPHSKLRQSFLDVMDRLGKGSTVHIDDFKAIVDEQSPLFIGYDQQDAHEFITTLLDLIDLDCKKNPEMQQSEHASQSAAAEQPDTGEYMDQEPEHDETSGSPERLQTTSALDDDHSHGSASKRQRTGELDLDRLQEAPCQLFPPVPSPFSTLDNDGIGQLIYGASLAAQQDMNTDSTHNSTSVCTQPRCKLVGGRMNTEGVQWEPFQPIMNDCDMAVDAPNRVQHRSVPAAGPTDGVHNDALSQDDDAIKSPVDSSFVMTCRVQMTCDSCKFTRSHNETYSHLSLEIGSDSGSLEDGLRRFFAPEKLECKCEKCFAESATRTLTVMDLPQCLLLHFKRFIVEVSDDYTSVSYRKNRSNVAFDDSLSFQQDSELSEYLDGAFELGSSQPSCLRYGLRSVINHIGSTASCGHYTADCKRFDLQTGETAWYRFNDEHVQSFSASTAIEDSQRTAYLVVYELDC